MSHNGGEGEDRRESYSWSGSGEFSGEDIREMLEGVVGMLNVLKDAMTEVIEKVMEFIEGDKVGNDVASFYKNLKESGLPEELVIEMTREYFKKRLEAVDIISIMSKVFGEEGIEPPRQESRGVEDG